MLHELFYYLVSVQLHYTIGVFKILHQYMLFICSTAKFAHLYGSIPIYAT